VAVLAIVTDFALTALFQGFALGVLVLFFASLLLGFVGLVRDLLG
jgi:hypothetical protein